MKIAYVVLHYLAAKDTIECVESILNNIKSKSHESWIVVMDNGSSNNSYVDLEKAFQSYPTVKLIKSKENLGFARGNNIGFGYAKYQLKTDFIVLLNNDTIINQIDFADVIVRKYKEKQYAVLGPDILTADGYHQNPGNKQSWSLNELRVYRLKKKIRLLLNYLHLDVITSKVMNQVKELYQCNIIEGDIENTILHGACLIFSPLYIKCFEGLHDETFLYMEEDILKLYADFYEFRMLYTSDLQIFHKEDVSTNMEQLSNNQKMRLKYKRLIKSSQIYSRLKKKMMKKKKVINVVEKVALKAKSSGWEYRIDLDMPLSYLIGIVLQRGIMLIRGITRSVGMKNASKTIFVGKKVILKCKSKMQIGTSVSIQNGVYLDALSKMGIILEDGSSIGSHTIIRCSGNIHELGQGFHLGKQSSLADNCFVGATGGVYIGDCVIGGQNIRFHSSNHIFEDRNKLIREQGITKKGIKVGNNCWIGAGTVFCDGVTIGNGCVIGASSVVTKSFPDNCVVAGNPAKVIRMRIETDVS